MADLFDFGYLKIQTSRYAVSFVASPIVKHFLRVFGVFVTAPLVAVMDEWNYLLNRDHLTDEYAKEIAAQVGKTPETVDARDMKSVAKENPTIAEALKRTKRKRNLDIAIDVGTTVATFFIIAALIPFAHITIPALLITGAIGFGGFVLSNYVLDKIGSKIFGMSEPSIKDVEYTPDLQKKLSVPSQVTYLGRQQKHRRSITSGQIITLFDKAKQSVSPEDARMWANKLNEGAIDATEMAFIVYGQRSGVEERESRELTQLERANVELQKDLAIARDKLRDASDVAMDKASVARDKAMEFAGSVKDKSAEVGGKAADYWRSKFNRSNGNSAITPDAIQAERQQQVKAPTQLL